MKISVKITKILGIKMLKKIRIYQRKHLLIFSPSLGTMSK